MTTRTIKDEMDALPKLEQMTVIENLLKAAEAGLPTLNFHPNYQRLVSGVIEHFKEEIEKARKNFL